MWQVWRHVCETQSEVTSDDFWNACPVELRQVIAHRGNTVGKMINESAQRRWITPTGRSTKTARPSGNRRAISVWRSLVVTYGNH
jgi:hypothetical protein